MPTATTTTGQQTNCRVRRFQYQPHPAESIPRFSASGALALLGPTRVKNVEKAASRGLAVNRARSAPTDAGRWDLKQNSPTPGTARSAAYPDPLGVRFGR